MAPGKNCQALGPIAKEKRGAAPRRRSGLAVIGIGLILLACSLIVLNAVNQERVRLESSFTSLSTSELLQGLDDIEHRDDWLKFVSQSAAQAAAIIRRLQVLAKRSDSIGDHAAIQESNLKKIMRVK